MGHPFAPKLGGSVEGVFSSIVQFPSFTYRIMLQFSLMSASVQNKSTIVTGVLLVNNNLMASLVSGLELELLPQKETCKIVVNMDGTCLLSMSRTAWPWQVLMQG